MLSPSLRRRLGVCLLVLLSFNHISAQLIRRRRPHYPKFEILWPLHWVTATYVWVFVKLGLIFAGLILLLVFRGFASWRNAPVSIEHGAPVYSVGEFSGSINEANLYWRDRIGKVEQHFRDL